MGKVVGKGVWERWEWDLVLWWERDWREEGEGRSGGNWVSARVRLSLVVVMG